MDIARRYGIPVIEDVAQALGASYKGRKLGTFGTSAFSLQFFKNVTSGEGGFVLTDDDLIYERVQMAGDTSLCWRPGGPAGRFVPPRYEGEIFAVTEMGNYRMSELTEAVALANFGKLRGKLERERRNIRLMMEALELNFIPMNNPEGSLGIALIFLCPDPETTDKVVRALRAEGAKRLARRLPLEPSVQGQPRRVPRQGYPEEGRSCGCDAAGRRGDLYDAG